MALFDHISFGVKAPDEETFRQSWIARGILENEEGYVFATGYDGIEITANQGWNGIISNPTGEVDAEGAPIYETVPAWHCNVRVKNPAIIAQFTDGIDPYDAEGNLKPFWDRHRAATFFALTYEEADPVTGFPAGYKNAYGIVYCDLASISSPSNVRQ